MQDHAHVLTRHSSSSRYKRNNHASECLYCSAHISLMLFRHYIQLTLQTHRLSMISIGRSVLPGAVLPSAAILRQDAVDKYVMERYWGDAIC